MVYTVVALLPRNPEITPSQFRLHYDNIHIPLLKSLVGSAFPLMHTRHYVSRKSTGQQPPPKDVSTATAETANEKFQPSIMYQGLPSDVEFDSLTVMTWENKESWNRFLDVFRSADVAERIVEDEEKFLRRDRKVVFPIEDPVVTTSR
jgi:hypothetical protein